MFCDPSLSSEKTDTKVIPGHICSLEVLSLRSRYTSDKTPVPGATQTGPDPISKKIHNLTPFWYLI